jgi:hypothetical protein
MAAPGTNTLHGVNVSVNDWRNTRGNINSFDRTSASIAGLEHLRGTQEGENQVRQLLSNQGISASNDQMAYWMATPAPAATAPSSSPRVHRSGNRDYPIVSSEYSDGSSGSSGQAVYNNPQGAITYGASGQDGQTAGEDTRAQHGNVPKPGLWNHTLHGVNISVNDYAYAKGDAGDFDAFSAGLQALEPLRGTKEAEEEVRRLLTGAGFAYTDDQMAYWLEDIPESSGSGEGGSASMSAPTNIAAQYVARIEASNEITREDITATPGINSNEGPGKVGGHEATVRQPETLASVNTRSVTNNTAPKAPIDKIVNPATGEEFRTPADARRAGVVNWVYKSEQGVA